MGEAAAKLAVGDPFAVANASIETQLAVQHFLFRQAEILDEKLWDDWLALFTKDGHYWMPAEADQTDGEGVPNIFWEDLDLMKMRIRRNNHPRAHSQAPENRLCHVVSNVIIESEDADGDNLTYTWTAPAGISLSSEGQAREIFFTPTTPGEYRFILQVHDGLSKSPPSIVEVTVIQPNRAPIADAGSNRTVDVGDAVQLDGSGSSDLDGNSLSYSWTRMSGSNVFLSGAKAIGNALSIKEIYLLEVSASNRKGSLKWPILKFPFNGNLVNSIQTSLKDIAPPAKSNCNLYFTFPYNFPEL